MSIMTIETRITYKYLMSKTKADLAHEYLELLDENEKLTAERERAEKAELEPVHLGFFHNDEEGIVNIYILDKDGNETGRIVKAECLLARISKYFNIAKSAEQERDSLARKLEGIREVYSLLKPMERDISTNKHHMERVMWEKIKAAVEEGE